MLRAHGTISLRLFLFFFQAEDGIRDYKVTGVQTCALPISVPGWGDRVLPVAAAGRAEGAVGLPARRPVGDDHHRPLLRHGRSFCRRLWADSEIGRASCRGKSVDLGGRRIIKKKK